MVLRYLSFINEKLIASFSKDVLIDFEIEGENHFVDRLARNDNELDSLGKSIISKEEVISDIKKAIPYIVSKNLFSNGLNWIPRQDILNKEICITNTNTNLNTVLMVRKNKENASYRYKFTIKTVMRKLNFIPYTSNNSTFSIKIN